MPREVSRTRKIACLVGLVLLAVAYYVAMTYVSEIMTQ